MDVSTFLHLTGRALAAVLRSSWSGRADRAVKTAISEYRRYRRSVVRASSRGPTRA